MAFYNQLLSSDCKMYSDTLPESNQTKASQIDRLKQERDESYIDHANALNNFWKKVKDGGGKEPQSDGEEGHDTEEKLKETSKDFESQLKDVLKSKSVLNQESGLEPPCALYGAFFEGGNLKYQKGPNTLTIESDHLSKESRLLKYLNDNYPDSDKYAYHFPVSYDFRTEGSDKRNICGKLSCCCLSHYSDEIIHEVLEQERERSDDLVHEEQDEDPEQKKRSGDPEKRKLNFQQLAKNVEEYLQRRNAFKAVQNVCERIELWSRRQSAIHMFIMANVKYKTYLKEYNRHKPVTANEGDHDILLIIKEIGIVFIQVKSCTSVSNDSKQIKKAFQQVLRDQFVFLESNRDLDFISPTFPMWGFIALPNISLYTLPQGGLCHAHRKIVLCREDLERMTCLSEILQESKNEITWTDEEFRYVCARYVGEGKPKGMQDLSKAIEGVIKMFGTKIFTPKQKTILKNENPCQVILGEFGSGKTLLLCKKAYDLSRKTENSTQQTSGHPQKTNLPNKKTNALTEKTKTDNSTQRTDTSTSLTYDPSGKTDDPSRKAGNPTQMINDTNQNAGDPTPMTDDPTQITDDTTQMPYDPTLRTDDLTQKTNDTTQKTDDPTLMTKDPSQKTYNPTKEKIYLITCVGLNKNCLLNTTVCHFPAIEQMKKYIKDIKKQQEKGSSQEILTEKEKFKTATKIEMMTLGNLVKKYKLLGEPSQNNIKLTSDKFNTLFSKLTLESKNIFIDEMPLNLFKDLEKYLLSKKKDYKGYEGYNVWVSIATQSCYGMLDPQADCLAANVKSKLFQSHFLEENMRNTCAIAKMMKSVCSYTGETLINDPGIGHCIEGPIPLLCCIPHCLCPVEVNKGTIFCECLERRIQCTLKFVHKVLGCTNKRNIDVVYMISHFYNDTFQSTIFDKLKHVFDKVFVGIDRHYSWLTLAETKIAEQDIEVTNSDTKKIKSETQKAKSDTQFDGKTAESDKTTTVSESTTAEYETQRAKLDTKATESDSKTAQYDTKTNKSDTWTTKTELIIDEATFAGCESSIVIYIDLLSMWQLLPANEENDQQLNKKTKVGAGSILIPSRCTSQYVHIILQGEEPRIFINEHIRMFENQRDSSIDINMQMMCNKAIKLMEECLQNKGELLEKLLNDGIMREIIVPSEPDDANMNIDKM